MLMLTLVLSPGEFVFEIVTILLLVNGEQDYLTHSLAQTDDC